MTDIDDTLPSIRFTMLLVSLVLYIVVYPMLPGTPGQDAVLLVFHTTIIFAGVWVLRQDPRLARIAYPLAVVTLATVWLALLTQRSFIVEIGQTLSIVFFALTTVQLVRYLARAKSADMATVLASICGFLMIAIIYAAMFSFLEKFIPTAFGTGVASADSGEHLYFSVVTLTTLGYGDIAPVHPMARSLVMTEAVIGQFYVAVIVARLVSLVITEKDRDRH